MTQLQHVGAFSEGRVQGWGWTMGGFLVREVIVIIKARILPVLSR